MLAEYFAKKKLRTGRSLFLLRYCGKGPYQASVSAELVA